ncbi:MAG: beta-lactamase family protein [Bacteroidetes bacterium]|nr:beta-lactamase family protein [Bacteroidota bacterium]
MGAAFNVKYNGKTVVDLWGGFRDKNRTKIWEKDTMVIVFSTTKGISSLAFSLLHSWGLLDYDEKVATYWPEFAKNGKKEITIRQLLAHQAGLLCTDMALTPMILRDEKLLSKILADQKPFWEPGKFQGYHAWTIALYQNEILKRIDPKGRSLSVFFREELGEKLGLDIHIGLPNSFNKNRIADLVPFNLYDIFLSGNMDKNMELLKDALNPKAKLFFARSLLNLPFSIDPNNFNKDEIRRLPIGSGCGFTSARDLTTLYHEFAMGGKNLGITKHTIDEFQDFPCYPTTSPKDVVMQVEIPFHLGMAKPGIFLNFGLNHNAYGSFCAGGSAVLMTKKLN